jgi:putative endonuclease
LSKNKEIGRKGEALAVEYLINKGFIILERNYRYGRLEIDIIGQIENTIVFVEVKTRRSKRYGYPEEAVDDKKTDHILSCADHFIYQNQWNGDIRFDIISVILTPQVLIEHIEDAFY